MRLQKWKYLGYGSALGLVLLGAGWGFGNFYLVVLGFLFIASSLASLTMPRP